MVSEAWQQERISTKAKVHEKTQMTHRAPDAPSHNAAPKVTNIDELLIRLAIVERWGVKGSLRATEHIDCDGPTNPSSQKRLSTLVHPKCHDEGCQAALALKAAPSTATPSAEALYWADEILSRATDYRAPSIICATELKRLAGIDMPQSSSPHEKKPHV